MNFKNIATKRSYYARVIKASKPILSGQNKIRCSFVFKIEIKHMFSSVTLHLFQYDKIKFGLYLIVWLKDWINNLAKEWEISYTTNIENNTY